MEQQSPQALQQEIVRLRERVAELEHDNALLKQSDAIHQPGEELLLSVLNTMTANVIVWDGNYDCLYANQAAIDHVGTTHDQVIGKNIRDGLGHVPEFMQLWMQRIDHVLATNEPLYSEDDSVSGDNTFYSESILAPVRSSNGRPTAVALVYQDITDRKKQQAEVSIFKTMADTAPDGFGMADADGTLTYANAAYRALTGYGDALIGMNFLDHFTETDRVVAREALTTTAEQGDWQGVLNFQHEDGSIIPVDTKGFVTRDESGNIIAVMGLFRDLREQYRQEAERATLQQQIIDAQRDALRELSTPLIPITDDVLIMPLIGRVDSQRAQMIMEALLEGVAQHQADLVILDITGVSVVDTQVAQAFIQAAQAVRLLGAQVMMTGIQPQIAQTLVHLGVDLGGIQTQSSLQAGIAAALRQ